MQFLKELKRSCYCGDVNLTMEGKSIVVMGWVETRRDHGGLVFVDLRDRGGILQVVLNPGVAETRASKDFRSEYVVAIQGVVRRRPEGMDNSRMKTGEVELEATRCEILSEAETPPFEVTDERVSENLRLKYRYLELRSPRLQNHLIVRHRLAQLTREFLSRSHFIEVETPILYKSTPEGARDYLVPSRVHPGQFYALPQSPQTLKQLLMVGGMDRYFQIARCFRDEDLRADRQPEFSQIDIEMSFIEQEDLMKLNEDMARLFWREILNYDLGEIPRLTYFEAMNRFGSDKPDLRNPLELKDITELGRSCGFKVFEDTAARGAVIKALAAPQAGSWGRSQMDRLTDLAKQMGAKGLVWIKSDGQQLQSPIAKFLSAEKLQEIFTSAGGVSGGLVLIVADDFDIACAALSLLRNHLGHELGLIDQSVFKFLWVVDFPLLEFDPEGKRWVARHHPFTMCKDEQLSILRDRRESEYPGLLAKAYDFVCNGYELAGGSLRIYRQDIQKAMFDALGLTEEETKLKFGFFIEALSYGTPPHGGIAWGMDRLAMLLCGTDAIRDVIAFPKTAKASCLMSEAPSPVARDQLLELSIRLAGPQVEAKG